MIKMIRKAFKCRSFSKVEREMLKWYKSIILIFTANNNSRNGHMDLPLVTPIKIFNLRSHYYHSHLITHISYLITHISSLHKKLLTHHLPVFHFIYAYFLHLHAFLSFHFNIHAECKGEGIARQERC